ncbi:hypothetical protein BD413DRAFT_643062 [Trametes elegans]|nr:hypothetical protein BD413DRAFT_643062 [Trametes elegans]
MARTALLRHLPRPPQSMSSFSQPFSVLSLEEAGTQIHAGRSAPGECTYDYIIVGGGTAGCYLTSRLSLSEDSWADRVPLISSKPYRDGTPILCGKALGGTSAINCMFYTRGPPGDHNRWEELGNPGWGYKDLEPYFANSPSVPAACYVRHDVSQDGSMRRHSPFHAFLPAKVVQERRGRLSICTNALVTRVELATGDAKGVQATGVRFQATDFRKAGKTYNARARREVVLCSGALGSPQILFLSGIGPKAHLEEKGIPVVRDLPGVGEHLQDHIVAPLTFEVPMADSPHELEASPLKVVKELTAHLFTERSLFSYPPLPGSHHDCLDLQIMPAPNNCTDHDIPRAGLFTLIVGLVRPRSRGRVRLATRNPCARPDVTLGFLCDARDFSLMRKGMRLALALATDMRAQGYPLSPLNVPDGAVDDDARANVRTCYHYTSTCRMGAEDAPGVVDAALRVHGLRGLRVYDTSVFPVIVGARTMPPAVVVAEKRADMIKEARREE